MSKRPIERIDSITLKRDLSKNLERLQSLSRPSFFLSSGLPLPPLYSKPTAEFLAAFATCCMDMINENLRPNNNLSSIGLGGSHSIYLDSRLFPTLSKYIDHRFSYTVLDTQTQERTEYSVRMIQHIDRVILQGCDGYSQPAMDILNDLEFFTPLNKALKDENDQPRIKQAMLFLSKNARRVLGVAEECKTIKELLEKVKDFL